MSTLTLDQAYQQADKHLEARRYQDAEKYYKTILNKYPADSQAKFGLAKLALEVNKPAETLRYLEPLLQEDPDNVSYRVLWLQTAYFDKALQKLHQQGQIWLRTTPDPEIYRLMGNAARDKGLWEKASEYYAQASEHSWVQADMHLMQALHPEGDSQAACNDMTRLAEEHSHDLLILKNAIRIALIAGDPDRAEPWLKTAIKLKGHDHELRALKGRWLHLNDQPNDALQTLNQAIAAYRTNPLAYAYLGWLFLDMNRHNDAGFCFARALSKQACFYQECEKLAELFYFYHNNPSKSVSALNTAISVNPGSGALYALKAFLQWADKDLDDPIGTAETTIAQGLERASRNLHDIHCLQAAVAAGKGEWDQARKLRLMVGKHDFYGLTSYAHALEKAATNDFKAAEKHINNALRIVPELTYYKRLLARILAQRKKKNKAIDLLESVLSFHPRDVDSRQLLIGLLAEEKRFVEAKKHDQLMMELSPKEAEKIIKERLDADPDNPQHLLNHAKVLSKQPKRQEEALEQIDLYLEKQPDSHTGLMIKGNTLKDQERFQEAEPVYLEVIEKYPKSLAPWLSIAQTYLMLDRWEEAEQAALKAYDMKKDYATCMALGQVFKELGGHIERVLELYDEAIAMKPDHPTAKWNKSLVLIHNNRIQEGMELYRYGFEAGPRQPYRKFSVPEWDGKTDIKGKRILCWREQGIGDEIRFATFYQDLINTGAHCIFEVSEKLKPLFKRSFPDAEVLLQRGKDDMTRTDIDYHIPAGELMRWFSREYPLPPVYKQYFTLSEEYLEKWRERFAELGEGLKFGICWRSSLQTARRNKQYMDMDDLEPLLTLPGITWINLQYDECSEELEYAREKYGITIHNWEDLDQKDDLDQTAAMISLLDLAIAAPSAVMDMCNALGKRVITWRNNATLENINKPIYKNWFYPAMTFQRYYKQSKFEIVQNISKYIVQ